MDEDKKIDVALLVLTSNAHPTTKARADAILRNALGEPGAEIKPPLIPDRLVPAVRLLTEAGRRGVAVTPGSRGIFFTGGQKSDQTALAERSKACAAEVHELFHLMTPRCRCPVCTPRDDSRPGGADGQ